MRDATRIARRVRSVRRQREREEGEDEGVERRVEGTGGGVDAVGEGGGGRHCWAEVEDDVGEMGEGGREDRQGYVMVTGKDCAV